MAMPGTSNGQDFAAAVPVTGLAGPGKEDPAAIQPAGTKPIAVLPPAVVRRIIGCLPLSMHGQCALVCRSWYASIPTTGKLLAPWLPQIPPQQLHANRHLAEGYSRRLRPWLARQNSELLPMLDCHYRELEQLRGTVAQETAPPGSWQGRLCRAQRLFSALVQYSLFHHQRQRNQLSVHTVSLPDPAGPVIRAQFSPCSRWLATARQQENSQQAALLHLYAWQGGSWQPESLAAPAPVQAVERLAFFPDQPGALVSGHSDGQVVSWQRASDSGLWQPVTLLQASREHRVEELVACADGAVLVVCEQDDRAHKAVLVLHERAGSLRWQDRAAVEYQRVVSVALAPDGRQLAMAAVPDDEDLMSLVLWAQNLDDSTPGAWDAMENLLEDDRQVLQLHYSPDGRYLLGLLSGQQACLWQRDADRRLHPCFQTTCTFSPSRLDLTAWRPFHHNSRQLVLARTARQTQFWTRQDDASWQPQDGPVFMEEPDGWEDGLRYLVFFAGGKALAKVTWSFIMLWECTVLGEWCRRYVLAVLERVPSMPNAWLLPPFGTSLCTVSRCKPSDLTITRTDSRHRLTNKTRPWSLAVPVTGLVCSPDGLSLAVTDSRTGHIRLLHMVTPVPEGAACRAGVSSGRPGAGITATRARPPGELSVAQTLPGNVLHLLFGYLPLEEHAACALVCRLWYASLPRTRIRLAVWRQRYRLQPETDQLAYSFEERVRPFLLAGRHRLLPVIAAQQGRQVRLQAQDRNRTRSLVACLIHYSVQQQLSDSRQLRLRPAVLDQAPGVVDAFRLSHCGRRLAVALFPQEGQGTGPAFLHIYSRNDDSWQEDALAAQARLPVEAMSFCRQQTDTLLSAHTDRMLLCLTRHPGTGVWRISDRGIVPEDTPRTLSLASMPSGDFVSVYRARGADTSRVSLASWQGPGRGWIWEISLRAPSPFTCVSVSPVGSRLALMVPPDPGGSGRDLDIWERDYLSASGWTDTEAVVSCQQKVYRLIFSPDGQLLLGLLDGQLARLWHWQEDQTACERLQTTCLFHKNTWDLVAWQPFRCDSRQLVLAPSVQQLQFWNRQANGDWTAGETLATPTPATNDIAGRLRYLRLSADGCIVLRSIGWELGIWQRRGRGQWQPVARRRSQAGTDPSPDGWFLPLGGPSCITVAGAPGLLWWHLPDHNGHLVKKAELCPGHRILQLVSSLDGLTVVLQLESAPLMIVQLEPLL